MLAQLNDCIGALLHLGPNVITFRASLHIGPNVIIFRTLLHLGQLLHLGLLQLSFMVASNINLAHRFCTCVVAFEGFQQNSYPKQYNNTQELP